MEEKSKQNSSNPPSTARLANLLKNPDLLSMNVNYQSTREAFLDIAYQLDDFQKTMSLFEEAESRYMKLTDMKSILQNIQKMNDQMDRNSEDLSTEIRELRQYFSFQIKELNTKVDHNLTNVINELTKPIATAPAPANNGENSIFNDNAYKSLKDEMNSLKERFESLISALSKPMSTGIEGEEEEEEPIETNANETIETSGGGSTNPQSPKTSERSEVPNTPTSEKGESPSSPLNNNSNKDDNNTPNNEENIDLNKNQLSTSSSVKFDKTVNESTSTPSLTTSKQIAANLKSNSLNTFKRIIEMRLDDIKIQLDTMNNQVSQNEEKLIPLIPVVQRNSAENGILRPELMKVKADVMLLKGDIDIMKDLQANSSVDFMKSIKEQVSKIQAPAAVDVEKPLTAMRHQIMQQFARMENAFNEQLKKLKAEIIGIKKLAINNSDLKSSIPESDSQNNSILDDEPIKVADSFANEEPAEKALLEQMQKEAEEQRKKKQEELDRLAKEAEETAQANSAKAKEEREKEIEKLQKSEEEKFLQLSARLSDSNKAETEVEKSSKKVSDNELLKQAQVETEVDESSKFRINTYTEVKNLPNQLVVSVLVDSPPRAQKVVHNDTDSMYYDDGKESANAGLTLNPTVAFEYARIGSASEDDLENVKKDIQNHQEIIERIVSQVADMSQTEIEVPKLSSAPAQDRSNLISSSELQALKNASTFHQRSIDDLNLKVDQLITLSNFANMSDEQKKDQKILDEILQHQNELKKLQETKSNSSSTPTVFQPHQIVLSPVHFTPLNLEPLKIYKARPNKAKQGKNNEPPKAKNPKKAKKHSLQPNKEAPAPALSTKTKDDDTVSIEVPPKPITGSSKSSKSEGKIKKEAQKSGRKEEAKNESQNQNTANTETDNENINNENVNNENVNNENVNNENVNNDNDDLDVEENQGENDIDNEIDDIPQNETETKKSPKSSHRSGSHHSSRHSSSHHSPSHHSSRSHKCDSSRNHSEKVEGDENEFKNEDEIESSKLEEKQKEQIENNEEFNKEITKENEEEEDQNNLVEEEEDQNLSQNSAEFFSPAESSVGSSVVYEKNESGLNEEEEEEEEEGMDPIISEKLQQLSDLLNSHQEQIKNIREGLVEVRSNVQLVKMEMKDQRSMLLLPQMNENSSEEKLERSKSSVDINHQIGDDNAIRAVRRRFDMQTREFENELYAIRKEIMEIRLEQSKSPQTVTERIIQVPMNNGINPSNVPSSPENKENDEDEDKNKKKKSSIFDDENKLLEIKPLSMPNKASAPHKIPKLPIIDQQSQFYQQSFMPANLSAHQTSGLVVTNTKQVRTQPTTPKQKKLPPIIPAKDKNQEQEKEKEQEEEKKMDNLTDFDENQTDRSQKSDSARNINNSDYKPFFNNIVQQSIDELNVLNATENVDEHILNLVIEVRSQLMLLIDKNTKRLNQVESRIDSFVDKDYVQKFFQKMRAVITEMNSSVSTMKQALPERVTKDEMQNLIEELYHSLTSDQETSGGTSNYRCLLCGRPKTSISGMIRDMKVAETLGQPTQTTITQSPNMGSRGTLIYGPDKQLYRGKGNFGKPTVAITDTKKQLPKMK